MTRRSRALSLIALIAAAALAVSAPASAKTATATFSRCTPTLSSAPLIDFQTIGIGTFLGLGKNAKGQTGRVTNVTAGVQVTHTNDTDLLISLVNPSGTVIGLSVGRGGAGDGFGSAPAGCSGTLARFDDRATTPISAPGNIGDGPVLGAFRPEQPLATFTGLPAAGVWMLVVTDKASADTGQVTAFDLSVTYTYKTAKKKKKKK